jgi:signal peptidase I
MNEVNAEIGAGAASSRAPEQPIVNAAPSPMTRPSARPLRVDTAWPGAVQSILVTVVIAFFIITFLLQAFRIPSPSMENTLLIGDYLLADKVHFAQSGVARWLLPYSEIKRGDIVLFRFPVQPSQHFVKRVIGVPGDRIRIQNKRVIVNGTPLNDSAYAIHRRAKLDYFRDNFPLADLAPHDIESKWWLEMRRHMRRGELVVPAGNYFVMGDNRDDSLDSRYWGFVPRENVIGRPLIIYWSLTTPWRAAAAAGMPDGKLGRFAYAVTHPWQFTRWERTLRLVR